MRFLICILIVFFKIEVKAQTSIDDLTSNFAFSVHSIDEFFDRFNYKSNTSFTRYIAINYPQATLNRKRILYSLFNNKNSKIINSPVISEFVEGVADTTKPIYLNYSDKYWYAQLNCDVIYKNKLQHIQLILKVEKSESSTFRWSIVSTSGLLYSTFKIPLPNNNSKNTLNSITDENRRKYFLSPVCHGIDFINVEDFFRSKENANYFIYNGPRTDELNKLLYLIENKQIKFKQTNSISYHILQIGGWILKINYFNRNEKNSGWLINSIEKASPKDKIIFLKSKLNVEIM